MQSPTTIKPQITKLPKEPVRLSDKSAIWAEFFDLTVKYKCTSLGQGCPDLSPPKFLKESVAEAMEGDHNQYCRVFGAPKLVTKVASLYGE